MTATWFRNEMDLSNFLLFFQFYEKKKDHEFWPSHQKISF